MPEFGLFFLPIPTGPKRIYMLFWFSVLCSSRRGPRGGSFGKRAAWVVICELATSMFLIASKADPDVDVTIFLRAEPRARRWEPLNACVGFRWVGLLRTAAWPRALLPSDSFVYIWYLFLLLFVRFSFAATWYASSGVHSTFCSEYTGMSSVSFSSLYW